MTHEALALAPADPTDDDQNLTDRAEVINPKNERLMQRFDVTETTAGVIASLDKDSGIHAGGYVSPEDAAPGVATGTTEAGHAVWYNMQKKYGDHAARNLSNQVIGEKDTAFASNTLSIPQGMSMEDARDLTVYGIIGPNAKVRPRPTVQCTAQDMVEGDPSVLLGKADYMDGGQKYVLEVATGKDSEGKTIGFSATRRKWNAAEHPSDDGYRGTWQAHHLKLSL